MIEITLVKKNGEYVSLESSGHAYYGEHGNDIVCAAVSILTINAHNALEEVAGVQPYVEYDEGEDGYLYFGLPSEMTDVQRLKSGVIFETTVLGLRTIEETYSDHIQIKYEEVHSDD